MIVSFWTFVGISGAIACLLLVTGLLARRLDRQEQLLILLISLYLQDRQDAVSPPREVRRSHLHRRNSVGLNIQ